MDIQSENNPCSQTLNKCNILVIGERKSGKTALIKSLFDNWKVAPSTFFLVDSVKIWEGTVANETSSHRLSFIEMDVEMGVLDQIAKFEEFLKGHQNILCLMMKNSESPTIKTQKRIRVFFEKFLQIIGYFSDSFQIMNNYVKKKDTTSEIQELYNFELKRLLISPQLFDFSENQQIFNYLKQKISNFSQFKMNKISENGVNRQNQGFLENQFHLGNNSFNNINPGNQNICSTLPLMNGVRSNLTGMSGIGGLNINNFNSMNLQNQKINNQGLTTTFNVSSPSNLNSTCSSNMINHQQLQSTLNLINHTTHLPQLNHITNLTHLKNLNNFNNLPNSIHPSIHSNLNTLNPLNNSINNMGQFNISQLITQNLNMNFTNYNNYNIQLNPISNSRTPNLNSPLNIKIDTNTSGLNSVNSNYKYSQNNMNSQINMLKPKNLLNEISRMNTNSTNLGSEKNNTSLIILSEKDSMIIEENEKIKLNEFSPSINMASHQQNSLVNSISTNYLCRKKKRRIFKIQKIERRDREKRYKIKIRREILDAVNPVEVVQTQELNNHDSKEYINNKINSNNKFQESFSNSHEYSNKLKIPNFDYKKKVPEQNTPKSLQENENFLQDSEDDDSHYNSRQNPNSLISISKEVYSYLKNMKESKGSEVTEYILEHLKKSQNNLSFKNIQRRVYDAINVMNAVGIIYKDRNNLMFRGGMENLRLASKPKPRNENKVIKEQIKNKINSINAKQHELVALCTKYFLSQKLLSLNKNDTKRNLTSDKLGFPFTLIKQSSDASLVIKQDDLNTRLCILSDKQFNIIYEEQIMKGLLRDDLKNMKNGLRFNINSECLTYLIKHNLFEKYFNNFTNFNSNILTLKEGFNTYSRDSSGSKPKTSRSPIYGLENSFSYVAENKRKTSIDFLLNKAMNEDIGSNYSHNDLLLDNNLNSFCLSPFEFQDRDFLDNGLGTNQMSTNFYSNKFIKNNDEKV